MREIKFRAWHKIEKRIFPVLGFCKYYVEQESLHRGVLTGTTYAQWKRGDCFLMQYTGLKDKNGKEIYEGDIIDRDGEKGHVLFENGCFWFENKWGQSNYLYLCETEVIGNIYENPELLK